jgi:hypothetical protein
MAKKATRNNKKTTPVTRKSRQARGAKAGPPKRAAKSSSTGSASAAANASCYVAVSPLHVTVARSKPKADPAAGPCIGLEQARNAVMDALLERIEEAERKLTASKHVTTLDELRSL